MKKMIHRVLYFCEAIGLVTFVFEDDISNQILVLPTPLRPIKQTILVLMGPVVSNFYNCG